MYTGWLAKRVHPTWHFTAACFGVIIGTAIAQWASISPVCVVLGLLLIMLAGWRQRRMLLIIAFLGGALIGLARGSIDQSSMATYEQLTGEHVQVKGTVLEDTDTNARGQAILHIGQLSQSNKQYAGKFWVTIEGNRAKTIQRGDAVTIDGELREGFGNFVGVMQNAELISLTREKPGHIAVEVRNNFSAHIQQAIDDPAASLGIGYLLGEKRGLPSHLVEALQIVGLTHIVVASGYNLTILVRLARRLFARISKYLSALVSIGLIAGFVAITGLSPSMTRAGLVALLSLWAWYYGRKFHPVTLLSIAAATTVLYNPSYVWGDIGWALSFAAFAGVMIIAPIMRSYFYGNEKPALVPQILGETISAQIATAPIILLVFGQFSNIAIISNLIILPFIPIVMLLTFIAGLGAYIVPGLAQIIGWPAQLLLDAMIWIIDWCSTISWAQVEFALPLGGVAAYYAILFAAMLYMARVSKIRLRETNLVE